MIIIEKKLINGVMTPVKDGEPTTIPVTPFGIKSEAERYLVFETLEEAQENETEIETTPQMGQAVQALLSATPEEIQVIKQILNS